MGLADRPAILAGDREVSWATLEAEIGRFADAYRRTGVAPGMRVLLLLDDSPELVAAYLGAIRAGAVAVAINTRSTPDDLQYYIEDSDARLVLIEPAYRDRFQAAAGRIAGAQPVAIEASADGLGRFLGGANPAAPAVEMAPDDMALWVYTSGTTGRPKGVVHAHRAATIIDRHLRENFGLQPGERLFCTSKIFFAYCVGNALLAGLKAGVTLIVERDWPSPELALATIARHRPQIVFSVPSLYQRIEVDGLAEEPPFRSVRSYVSAGEKLPLPILERWQAATGKPILEGIGTSETLALFIANTPAMNRPEATGKPMPWAEVELRDESGAPITAPNTNGNVWIRMPSLFVRYWNQPERTQAAFDGSWFCTGDVFSRDEEGWLYHQGRRDDLLKVRGQWVSPGEVEEHALELPEVAEAAAVAVTEPSGLAVLALFVVTHDPCLEAKTLLDRLKPGLAPHKLPRHVRMVPRIPRTATGKVQRFLLRRAFVESLKSAS